MIIVSNAQGRFTVSKITPFNDELNLTIFLNAGEYTIPAKLTTTLKNLEERKATANYGLTDAAVIPIPPDWGGSVAGCDIIRIENRTR